MLQQNSGALGKDMVLPAEVRGFFGRIRDVDQHEMTPVQHWENEFGPEVKAFVDTFITDSHAESPNSVNIRVDRDDKPMTPAGTYWAKAANAPSAFDMSRRVEFLDLHGIKDTFMFGTGPAIIGGMVATIDQRMFETFYGKMKQGAVYDSSKGVRAIELWNDWCVRVMRQHPRLNAVPTVLTKDLDFAVKQTEKLIADGVRAVNILTGVTISDKAPAHPDNDVLWKLLADNNVTLISHVGGEVSFLREGAAWTNAPQFKTVNSPLNELDVNPFTLGTFHLSVVNFLSNMILGGVFERVPNLRFGAIELNAHWIGPMAEHLDTFSGQFREHARKWLSMPPSEYVRRNIRVNPFPFEPIDKYMERFPILEDVLCFGSDFPHIEGGKDPIVTMTDKLKKFGSTTLEKFFVTNAEWILGKAD